MAIVNVGGHGVTTVLSGTHHNKVTASQPNFKVSPGATDWNGNKGPKAPAGFPPAKAPAKGKVSGPYTGMTTY